MVIMLLRSVAHPH